MDNTFDRVRDILMFVLCVESSEIESDSKLVDLGADSLDMAMIESKIEECFDIDIPDHKGEIFYTVRDIVEYVDNESVMK